MSTTEKSKHNRQGAPGVPKSLAHRRAIAQAKVRHGLRAGKLPRKLQYIEHRINAFRRSLEDRVLAEKGEISIVDAASINTACKWERHGALAQDWLRKEAEKLSAGERLKFSEAIAKASNERDKNLRLLGLDVQRNVWNVIDAPGHGGVSGA